MTDPRPSDRPGPRRATEPIAMARRVDGLPEPDPLEDDRGTSRGAMWLRIGIMVFAVGAAVLLGNVVELPHVPLCGMKAMTGYPCPGCGMTRSMVNLGSLNVLMSLRFHPLGVVVLAASLSTFVGAVIGLIRGRDPVWSYFVRKGHVLMISFVIALVLIWVVRVFIVPEWSPDPIGSGAFGDR